MVTSYIHNNHLVLKIHNVMDFQLEEQLKELMEEKDTVQSELENFRKVASDDQLNYLKARRWVLALSCITVIFLI